MKPIKPVIAFMALSGLILSGAASAKWSCPSTSSTSSKTGSRDVITGVGYNWNNYQPRVHFKSQKPDEWAYLLYGSGVNKDYGKAMLAIALTAYSTGATVMTRCDDSSLGTASGQTIDGLWISDDGSKSDN